MKSIREVMVTYINNHGINYAKYTKVLSEALPDFNSVSIANIQYDDHVELFSLFASSVDFYSKQLFQ